ncbi:MAG: hypothetical protein HYT15_01750 [Candidatus Magasanikbacteria bacterium]|nr:hypothetical protein [Candidatus Magasanikbacteria bacterium]
MQKKLHNEPFLRDNNAGDFDGGHGLDDLLNMTAGRGYDRSSEQQIETAKPAVATSPPEATSPEHAGASDQPQG